MTSLESLKLDFVTLDVFTTTRFLGNPLAVVFVPASKRSLVSQEAKQRIAREFNLSETVFLHTFDDEPNPESATREIDIFLTTAEIPFAGHPTIGSASLVLQHLGWTHVDTLLTKAGPIGIQLLEGGSVGALVPHAVHIHRQTLKGVVDSESTPADVVDKIHTGLSPDPTTKAAEMAAPIVDIVKGMTFVLVKLPTLHHLSEVKATGLELSKIPGLLDHGDTFAARYYYVVMNASTSNDGYQTWRIQTRNVELGFEDPATGSAACALTSYLTIAERPVNGASFFITQGVEMGRRSDIFIRTVARGEAGVGQVGIESLHMAGKAVVVMNGSIAV